MDWDAASAFASCGHVVGYALVSLGPKDNGRVFRTRYIKTAYNNAVTTAKPDDVNFHTLRHTFASWAVMRGVSLKELQELLGQARVVFEAEELDCLPHKGIVIVGSSNGGSNRFRRDGGVHPRARGAAAL